MKALDTKANHKYFIGSIAGCFLADHASGFYAEWTIASQPHKPNKLSAIFS